MREVWPSDFDSSGGPVVPAAHGVVGEPRPDREVVTMDAPRMTEGRPVRSGPDSGRG